MESILKVKSVSEIKNNETGNGVNQKIEVQEYKVIPGVGLVATINTATRVLFSGITNTAGEVIKSKDQILFNNSHVGDIIAGKIAKVATTPYNINGNIVTSFSTVIFEGENEVKIINNQLKNKGAVMVTADGTLTAELPKAELQES